MIRVEHLNKNYTHKKEIVPVFSDLNFELPDCGLVSIVGHSGSGKTTLLRILSSFDKDYSGNVFLNDRDLRTLNDDSLRQQTFGFLYQEASLLRNHTAQENIELPFRLFGLSYDPKRLNELVTALQIKPLLKRKTKQLSVGQRQRVALCRALLKDNPILFADEPTSSLDNDLADELFRYLVEYAKTHLVVVVTHDRERAEQYSDALYQLEDGSLTSLIPYSKSPKASSSLKLPENGWKVPFSATVKNGALLTNKALFSVFSFLTLMILIPMTLSFSLGNYNRDNVMLNSYYGTNTLLSVNRSSGSVPDYEATNSPLPFNYVESQEIEAKMEEFDYLASSARFEVRFPVTGIIDENGSGTSTFIGGHQQTAWRAFSLNQDVLDTYGFSLLEGRLPAEGENELVITRFQFEDFSSGLVHYYRSVDEMFSSATPLEINGYEDILNTTVSFKNKNKTVTLKIVGVIETYPDPRVYEYYKNQNSSDLYYLLENTALYTYHNALYLPSSIMNDYTYSNSPIEIGAHADFSEPESTQEVTNPQRISLNILDKTNFPGAVDFFEPEKTDIEVGEIAVTLRAFKYPVVNDTITEFVSYYDLQRHYIFDYAKDHLPDGFSSTIPEMSDTEYYVEYILGHAENTYAPEYNRSYFQNLTHSNAQSYILDHFANEDIYVTQQYFIDYSHYYYFTKPMRLVGIFNEVSYGYHAVVTQPDFEVFYSYYYADLKTTDSFVIKLSRDRSKDLALIHFLQDQSYYVEGTSAHIQFNDPVMMNLTKFNQRFESLKQPFSFITYAGISLVALFLVLQTVVSNRSLVRRYKLLFDLGASRRSILISYALVSLVMLILCVALGLGCSYVIVDSINQAIVQSGGIILLLGISAKEISFILGTSLGLSALMFLTNFAIIQFDFLKNRSNLKKIGK